MASDSARSRTKQVIVAVDSVHTNSSQKLGPEKSDLTGVSKMEQCEEDNPVQSQFYHQHVDGSVTRLLYFQVPETPFVCVHVPQGWREAVLLLAGKFQTQRPFEEAAHLGVVYPGLFFSVAHVT